MSKRPDEQFVVKHLMDHAALKAYFGNPEMELPTLCRVLQAYTEELLESAANARRTATSYNKTVQELKKEADQRTNNALVIRASLFQILFTEYLRLGGHVDELNDYLERVEDSSD